MASDQWSVGPVKIELIPTDDVSGAVLLGLKTADISLEILVTRAGMVRVYVPEGGMVMVCAAEREEEG